MGAQRIRRKKLDRCESDRFVGRIADVCQGALCAQGVAGDADGSAKQNDLMAEGNPPVLRDHPHQILFDFFRRLLVGQFQPVGDSEDVRIHHDAAGDAVGRPQDHVGGFARDAGQRKQFIHCSRDFSPEVLHDLGGGADDVLRLVAVEACGTNLPFQILLRQAHVILGGGVFAE